MAIVLFLGWATLAISAKQRASFCFADKRGSDISLIASDLRQAFTIGLATCAGIIHSMSAPTVMTRAYEEIIDFLAAGTTPESLINFQPSEVVKERVAELIVREKMGNLADDEKAELDHYLMLEHLLRLAKARAYQYIPVA
jgi:hypothetical protein